MYKVAVEAPASLSSPNGEIRIFVDVSALRRCASRALGGGASWHQTKVLVYPKVSETFVAYSNHGRYLACVKVPSISRATYAQGYLAEPQQHNGFSQMINAQSVAFCWQGELALTDASPTHQFEYVRVTSHGGHIIIEGCIQALDSLANARRREGPRASEGGAGWTQGWLGILRLGQTDA
ncbi:hypothetical protein BKA70DRAFT_1408285 [Coprinopsis sp. MPI-PUGE-AT-0042]|nr:hypothetical protein BKA70DRAFT_1408285 [Coprinopsis sp. MPI-PUGE-AT-0042]